MDSREEVIMEKKMELLYEQAKLKGELSARDQKLYDLTKDKDFAEKLSKCTSKEEMWALFAQQGVEFTPEEQASFINMALNLKEKSENGGELSEEELEQVAGGFDWLTSIVIVVLVLIVAASAVANFIE